MIDSDAIISINEPQLVRPSFTPASINEPPELPPRPDMPVPVIASIEPTEATIGDASFTLYVTGEQFLPGSTIIFAGMPEPTTLEGDGRLSTGVNMDVWLGPDTVKVSVLNGDTASNEVDFTFHPEGGERFGTAHAADPDELEDEIEQAEEEGEFKSMHPAKKKK
jgi:hypothetical protein